MMEVANRPVHRYSGSQGSRLLWYMRAVTEDRPWAAPRDHLISDKRDNTTGSAGSCTGRGHRCRVSNIPTGV